MSDVVNTYSMAEDYSKEERSAGATIQSTPAAAEEREFLCREIMAGNFVEKMVRSYVVAHYKGEAVRKRTKFKI